MRHSVRCECGHRLLVDRDRVPGTFRPVRFTDTVRDDESGSLNRPVDACPTCGADVVQLIPWRRRKAAV